MELIEQLDKLAADATKEALKYPADNIMLGLIMQKLSNDAAAITTDFLSSFNATFLLTISNRLNPDGEVGE